MSHLFWVQVVSSLIFAGLAYDIAESDGFYNSQTYQYIKNAGIIEYGNYFYKITEKILKYTACLAEGNFPFSYDEVSPMLKLYINLVYDYSLILSEIALELTQTAIKILDIALTIFGDTILSLFSDLN